MDTQFKRTPEQVDNLDIQLKKKNNSTRLFAYLNLTSISIIILLIGYILWYDYNMRVTEANKNTQITANLYAAHTRETILKLEKMLLNMDHTIQLTNLNIEQVQNKTVHKYLLKLQSNYSYLMDILIVNPKGEITQWTGKNKPPSIADRPYVQFHLNNKSAKIHVSNPLISKVHKGEWFFSVSIPIYKKSNELQYIAVAIIDIKYFQEHFKKKAFIQNSSLILTTQSGSIITRNPEHNKFVGHQIDLPPEMKTNKQYGNFEFVSPFDQINRIVGYYKIKEYGMIASIATPKSIILSQWYSNIIFSIIILLIIILTLCFSTFKIISYQSKMDRQRKQLYKMANTDELTGLLNRRRIYTIMQQEVGRAERYQRKLSFVMMDIDHFKNINDQYGHEVGDKALQHIANVLSTSCRDEDFPSRYGGEEFLIILPETDAEKAMQLAERLRKDLDASIFIHNAIKIHLTASFGVSTYIPEQHKSSAEVAMKLADNALYKAKNSGRNTVCT